ncbi:hypothetical protein FIBSPDRAFT_590503 [Athelia psychrophila]|uniref:Uncharacterized protein n=1 Tax=Athelia psychrophila TaxID=1759441 RepID=A0A166H9F0_9AGAM|nr:hypothetical protein FIBSPDRAFT_590503 [Fibularhizoctonia sp. CBS 109695]
MQLIQAGIVRRLVQYSRCIPVRDDEPRGCVHFHFRFREVSERTEGTAVYLFCVVPNQKQGHTLRSNFNVQLSGDIVHTFTHKLDGTMNLNDTYRNASLSTTNYVHIITLVRRRRTRIIR